MTIIARLTHVKLGQKELTQSRPKDKSPSRCFLWSFPASRWTSALFPPGASQLWTTRPMACEGRPRCPQPSPMDNPAAEHL